MNLKNNFTKEELLSCGHGNMFGIGNNFLIQKNSELESLVKKN